VVTVTIQYERLIAIYVPVENYVIALTLNPGARASAAEIASSVKALIDESRG
jgi:hypothetical protein